MSLDGPSAQRFNPRALAGLDEPVRRFFTHAIREGAPVTKGVRLRMAGRVKPNVWLPFSAEQDIDGRSFAWRARVGWGPVTPLRVVDSYADGAGRTEGRLFGRVPLFHAGGTDTARSAACRAALESVVFAPACTLPGSSVAWRADGEDTILASFDLPPEHPKVHVRIDQRGAVRSAWALRWGNPGQKSFDYVPCGCDVRAERQFGDLVLASSVTVSWWFGTPRSAPFFEADIHRVDAL